MYLRALKSNHCFAVLDRKANVSPGGKYGVYLFDTRHISEYCWDFGPQILLSCEDDTDRAFSHWGLFEGRAQVLSVEREIRVLPDGFEDDLLITNEGRRPREVHLSLTFDADFFDIFEARGR